MRVSGLLIVGLALAFSFPAPGQTPAPNKPIFGAWGFDLTGMDRSTRPGDDFFRYANGAWFDKAVVQADRTSTGSFVDLDIQSEQRVQDILASLEQRKDRLDAGEKRVRDLYRSYTDAARLERLGLEPVRRDMAAIEALQTHEDIAKAMGTLGLSLQGPFRARIGVDDKFPDRYAVFIRQAGLGLPDRDYYLLPEKGVAAARAAYAPYIAGMLGLADIANAAAKADAIFALETQIAKLHWTRVERREAGKTYNPMTVAELESFAQGFPWRIYLSELGIPDAANGKRRVIAGENTAFPELAKLFRATPVSVWRDYLTFHYLSAHAPYLAPRFDDARFAFYGKILGGQNVQLAREKRAVRYTGGVIGEDVGKLYVARYFPPEAKTKASALVQNLLRVYRQRIQAADWMSPETKNKALEKVASFTVKIGYPDKWRDYSKLEVREDDLIGNQRRAALFDWNYDLERLDKQVDRSEWGMSPQTVNAYYDSSLNEIVFPAGILQAPFFDPNADDAVNYGGIGAVIGHEISHGFDDQGSKYDAKGVLTNWWTDEDRKNFDSRTGNLAKQYDSYSPIEGLFVNGKMTLGENIADLAGLTVAQAAYRLSLGGKPAQVLDGFTGDQRLFLGYAQVWRYKARDETVRQRVLTDSHSPPQFRVNGAVRNVDGWYQAMGIESGNKLYLGAQDRIRLW